MTTPSKPPVPGSGDEALRAAAERANSTRERNMPQWPDLPIPGDTANLREGPGLHDACLALLPLIGVWRGEGEVVYPTIESQHFGQQVVFAHDGRPFVYYESRAWLLDADGKVIRPAAREVGWWRPKPDDTIDKVSARSMKIVGTASAKEVNGAKRLYGLVNNGDLAYVEERAMMGQPLQPHTSAYLRRVAG